MQVGPLTFAVAILDAASDRPPKRCVRRGPPRPHRPMMSRATTSIRGWSVPTPRLLPSSRRPSMAATRSRSRAFKDASRRRPTSHGGPGPPNRAVGHRTTNTNVSLTTKPSEEATSHSTRRRMKTKTATKLSPKTNRTWPTKCPRNSSTHPTRFMPPRKRRKNRPRPGQPNRNSRIPATRRAIFSAG